MNPMWKNYSLYVSCYPFLYSPFSCPLHCLCTFLPVGNDGLNYISFVVLYAFLLMSILWMFLSLLGVVFKYSSFLYMLTLSLFSLPIHSLLEQSYCEHFIRFSQRKSGYRRDYSMGPLKYMIMSLKHNAYFWWC